MTTTAQLTENSHQGFDGIKAGLCLGSTEIKSNPAPELQLRLWRNCIGSRSSGKERDTETGLDYFLARYYSGAQGRFLSPDEFKGGIVDPFTGQQISQPGPLPYADISHPQTLNKYGYVRNNPLRYIDPDGHEDDEADGLALDWLNVIEIKGSVGIGVGVSGQAGGVEYRARLFAGAEAKSGLGGGNWDVKNIVEAKLGADMGQMKAGVNLEGSLSVKGAKKLDASANASIGKAGVTINKDGASISNPSVGTKSDTKLGVGATAAIVGVDLKLNLSQARRAQQKTKKATQKGLQALSDYIDDVVQKAMASE